MHLHDTSAIWQQEVVVSETSRYSGSMERISDGIMMGLSGEIMEHLMEVSTPGSVTSIGDVQGKSCRCDMVFYLLVMIAIGSISFLTISISRVSDSISILRRIHGIRGMLLTISVEPLGLLAHLSIPMSVCR